MAAPVPNRGAGALGGLPGAWRKGVGHDVTCVDIVPDRVAAMENPARGPRVTGLVERMQEAAHGKRGVIDDGSRKSAKRYAEP